MRMTWVCNISCFACVDGGIVRRILVLMRYMRYKGSFDVTIGASEKSAGNVAMCKRASYSFNLFLYILSFREHCMCRDLSLLVGSALSLLLSLT